MNPIDTATQMWGAVEVAWERDVMNGDARSRAEFFSYATVSVFGLKGVDKLGKAGKVGNATSKADTTLPYNALKTDKLKDTVKANVYATVQQKTEQAAAFWKSNFSKEAINKTIEAAKNSAVMTKAKNTLDSANIKETATKTYQDVVKTPIAKTQAAWEKKKNQLLDTPLPNLGLSSFPLGPTANMTVREGIEAAQNTVMQMVGNKDGGGKQTKGDNLETRGYRPKPSERAMNKEGWKLLDRMRRIETNYPKPTIIEKSYENIKSNPKYYTSQGEINWPPNRGVLGEPKRMILKPGTFIDRFGYEGGTFVSPYGVPYEMRALAPETYLKPYQVYVVKKNIEVEAGEIAPWFDEPGLGIQYELKESVKKLIDKNVIVRMGE